MSWKKENSNSLPTATSTQLGGVKIGTGLSVDETGTLNATGGSYTLPPASTSTLGGIIVGNGLSVSPDGTLSTSGGQTQVTTTGRPYALFSLRGGIINVQKSTAYVVATQTTSNTCTYTFPTLDSNRFRRLFVWTAAGDHLTIDIPDGTLNDNDALVYDISTNTLSTKNGTWGNIAVSQNEYLLLYNNLGNIGGILSKYVVMGYDNLSIPLKEIPPPTLISNSGSTQGMFILAGNIYKCTNTSTDDHTTYANITVVSKSTPNTVTKYISQNIGHMNAVNYSSSRDSLIVGNGSKSYTLLPKGWIFPNFSSYINAIPNNGTMEFNTIDKIELDFSQFTTEYKGQLCWGYDGTDIVYLFTNDSRILRKVLLGKGTTNLGTGTFVSSADPNRYNGSYQILNTWYSRTSDILSDMKFYKGFIYIGVKGSNSIRKCIPNTNGYFDSVYYPVFGAVGDMQGIEFDSSLVYAFTDTKGYTFDPSELIK